MITDQSVDDVLAPVATPGDPRLDVTPDEVMQHQGQSYSRRVISACGMYWTNRTYLFPNSLTWQFAPFGICFPGERPYDDYDDDWED